jgi:hypothetical protein
VVPEVARPSESHWELLRPQDRPKDRHVSGNVTEK